MIHYKKGKQYKIHDKKHDKIYDKAIFEGKEPWNDDFLYMFWIDEMTNGEPDKVLAHWFPDEFEVLNLPKEVSNGEIERSSTSQRSKITSQ